jgi:hypothetical protein
LTIDLTLFTSTSHAAWDVDAVHGVQAMHSMKNPGTAMGGRNGGGFEARCASSAIE